MAVEEFQSVVRFRVSFPKHAYARLEALAEKLAMDVPSLVRFMASLQLAQMEIIYNNPETLMNVGLMASRVVAGVESAYPEAQVSNAQSEE